MPRHHVAPRSPLLSTTTSGVGRRVVLIHGFTQTKDSWKKVAQGLSVDCEVVAVDLPEHGESGAIVADDLEHAARTVYETVGKAAYVGYSLGGRIALTVALETPHLVDRLVLVSTTAGITDAAQRRVRRHADEALAERLDPSDLSSGLSLEKFLDEWLSQPLFRDLDASAKDREARRANTTRGLAGSLRRLGQGAQHPQWDELARLDMPVLVIVGERDEKFRALGSELVAGIGTNASLTTVSGAGHAVPFEQPETFCALVGDFIRDEAS